MRRACAFAITSDHDDDEDDDIYEFDEWLRIDVKKRDRRSMMERLPISGKHSN